ncbi:MAG: hypothetical protein JO358_15805 [Alphaproteobacteria bacterium]|nr:hypothetical protein [Alphaproteobacteria bacterium]
MRELRWRLEYTADLALVRASRDRVLVLASMPELPSATAPDAAGCYGVCTEVWFLKLDASIDHLLAPGFEAYGKPPNFLNRINHPDRLLRYLDGLLVSRLAEEGVDHRKELNLSTANLVRLILWRRPANYHWDPRLEGVVRRFIDEWQDPETGFFGATYLIGEQQYRTTDLSLTFHMARYLEGRIGYWPQLIDTLLEIRDDLYPNGWLDEVGMSNHNNYDVVTLFQLGWREMRADQRNRASGEIDRLLDWCITTAIAPDGRVLMRARSESLPESYYFAVAFLDVIGYFDPAKRFWTDLSFPDAAVLRDRLERQIRLLNQEDPMTRMALARLAAS